MSEICAFCSGSGQVRRYIKRTWWLPRRIDEQCQPCSGTGIMGLQSAKTPSMLAYEKLTAEQRRTVPDSSSNGFLSRFFGKKSRSADRKPTHVTTKLYPELLRMREQKDARGFV